MAAIHYSRGTSVRDNSPETKTAADFGAFMEAVLSDTAKAKGLQYIAAPFKVNGNGKTHRSKEGVLSSAFVALDLDGFTSPEYWHATMDVLQKSQGFAYTTYSSKPDAPRARVVLAASREMDRGERLRVSKALERWLNREVGDGFIVFDPSVYKAEQPLFTPPEQAETYRFTGKPVDVDKVLATAPEAEPQDATAHERAEQQATEDPVLSVLQDKGMVIRPLEAGKFAVVCPFDNEHSKKSSDTATAYMLPNFGGVKDGKFVCMHSHCNGRTQPDFLQAIGLDPKRVWAAHRAGKGTQDGPPPLGEDAPPDGWEEPAPLPDVRAPVAPFDPDLLPGVLKPWLLDIAERMQCPLDYPAVGAMVSLGAVIGRQLGIKPKRHDDWLELPNIWGAPIGPPGFMKSPALAEATRPLLRIANEAREAFQQTEDAKEREAEMREAKVKALRGELQQAMKGKGTRHAHEIDEELAGVKAEGEPGTCPRYLVNDPSIEKLGEILADNPNGVLLFRDELVGWLRSLDKEGSENARPFYLEAWGGKGSYTYDRIGRGTIHIEAACVSVLGGIQPGPLAAYVKGAMNNGKAADGLLQRLQLLVWPDDPGKWKNVDRWPNTEAKNAAFELFSRLSVIDTKAVGAMHEDGQPIPFLHFDEPAQELFTEWRQELENTKLRSGDIEAVESHLSKYRKLIPALALICHLAEDGTGPVTERALLRACAWGEYLETHARRVYGAALRPEVAAGHALAAKIQAGALPDGFKPKDVYRNCWKDLGKDETYKAIELLEDLDWIRTETMQTGGRPSLVCWINPLVGVPA